ncbi:MAG TPA: hypothetical protein VIL04_07165 [Solirubrobacterales bacterium]|jgi:hypothetical protein
MESRLVSGLRDLIPLALALAVPTVALIAHAGLLAALPLLVVVLPLLFGRYPGSAVLARLAERRRPRRRPRAVGSAPRASFAHPMPRSGRLLATGLAKRPPPAPLTAF